MMKMSTKNHIPVKLKISFWLLMLLVSKNELLAQLSFGEAFDGYITKAELAYEQGSYELAGNYYDTALKIKNGKYPLSGYYGDALKAWIKAANTDQSFFYLEKLVTEGWLSIHDFNNSEYFQLLRQDSRWPKIIAIINRKDELYGQVRNQLEKIRNEDQALRRILSCAKDQFREDTTSMAYFFDLMKHQDSLNLHHVERIIQQYGWLAATNVGDKANRTLWLILQHASLEKQEEYIPMIKQSVLSGETRPSELAFLQDRIAYERMEKQLYGTQIVSISETGQYKIYPIQDPEYVDQRRQEIGLEPLHSYLSFFGITEISIKSLDDPSVFDYLTSISPFKSTCQEADNLVPNPSFSEYKKAMEFIPQFADEQFTKNVEHWYSAADPSFPPHFVTPYLKSELGQKPLFAYGDSIFAGLILGVGGGIGGSNIGVELKQALSSQKKYLVKMRIAVPPIDKKRRYPKVLPDNFGVLFSQDKIVTTQEALSITRKPQIDFRGTALQPFRWIELEQVFQPEEEGLNFLTLGVFCPNPVPVSFNNYYRYFIDHVCVVETELDVTPLMPVAVIPEFKPTPVYFSTGKTEIVRHKTALDSLVNYLQLENLEIQVQLTGYADAIGTENSNVDLSRKRAMAVFEYLVKNGIDSTRIKVKWEGEINAQSEGQLAKSRRVDIALLEPSEELSAKETAPSIPADWQSVYRFSAELEKQKNTAFNEIAFTCIGEYERATAKSGNSEPEPVAPEDQEVLKHGIQADAVNYLVKRAEQEKIILINEAHNRPKHRAFVALLLDSLYQKGYRYLGLEMLFPSDTNINLRGYPILSSGFYLQEPIAGELVRMALEIGYEVFGYDANAQEIEAARETWAAKDELFAQLSDFEQEMNARDRVQANKIAKKMNGDKNSKYLILAGFGHIRENITGNWQPMAYQLKKHHQIDPFSVDQIAGNMDIINSPFAAIKPNNRSLTILKAGDQQPFSFKTYDLFSDAFVACFDMQVVHAKTQTGAHGRPVWLTWNSTKKAISVSKFIPLNTPLPCLLLAYFEPEDIRQAVPADVVELRADYSPHLMLSPGKYNVLVKCVNGQIFKKKITVE